MTRDQLRKQIKSHNRFMAVVGAMLILAAVVLWILSFCAVRILAESLLDLVGTWSYWHYVSQVTWGAMFLLAFEGIRYALHKRDEHANLDAKHAGDFIVDPDTGAGFNSSRDTPLAWMHLVTRILFCAPIATVEAFASFRSRLPNDKQTIDDASVVLDELRSNRGWTPSMQFKQYGSALLLLMKMKLIWSETRDGEVYLRIPPGD